MKGLGFLKLFDEEAYIFIAAQKEETERKEREEDIKKKLEEVEDLCGTLVEKTINYKGEVRVKEDSSFFYRAVSETKHQAKQQTL